MMAKMSKTEISAKIMKRKKSKFLLSESNQKLISTRPGQGLSIKPNRKQNHEAVQALKSDIGFWRPSLSLLKKLKKEKNNYQANSPGPICILQIFGNNPSRGFRVRAETK